MTSQQAKSDQFAWLVTDFTERVAGVAHAVVVSADGLLLIASDKLPRDRADQLSAVASGLLSLTQGAARCFEAGEIKETIVEMDRGMMLQMAISDGSCLTVLAAPQCDMGLIAYEMAMLVERVGRILTPELRSHLHGSSHSQSEQLV